MTSQICSWFRLPIKRKTIDNQTIHQTKKRRTVIQDSTHNTREAESGWFTALPIELLHMLFQYLDKESIITFSSLSKDLNSDVLEYFLSTPGKMLGSISGWLTITKRLRMANYCKEKLVTMGSEYFSDIECTESFGQLLFSYVTNWNNQDKKKAFCLFAKTVKLEQKINRVLRYSPGSLPWQERHLRELLHRTLLLPSLSDLEYGFWLTQILRAYPITNQARLIFILTGPTDCTGSICWHCTCGCLQRQGRQFCDVSELAKTLKILLRRLSDWSTDDIVAIFNDLTTIPCGWCLDTVAELLVKSGDELCKGVLGSKALTGHIDDLSIMFYHLACYCYTNESHNSTILSNWYIDILLYTVGQLSDREEKRKLTNSIFVPWLDATSILQFNIQTDTDIRQFVSQCDISITSLSMIANSLIDKLLKL